MIILGAALSAAIWLILIFAGSGTIRFWRWNAESWTAVTAGVTGYFFAFFAALTWRWQKVAEQRSTLRELLVDGLVIHALKEAWILEGQGWQSREPLSQHPRTQVHTEDILVAGIPNAGLRAVEVRDVLDEAEWNAPGHEPQDYGVVVGRRAWIVRDAWDIADGKLSYEGTASRDTFRPALLSSRALHELCGWIERATAAWNTGILTADGLESLSFMLKAVSGEDRRQFLRTPRLTPEALKFLERWWNEHSGWHPKASGEPATGSQGDGSSSPSPSPDGEGARG